MNTEIVVTNDIININVTDQIVIIEAPSGAYPLPSGVYSVYGRTGNVIAQEGDYNLTQLGDVTISTPSTGQVLRYNGTAWVNSTESYVGTVTSVAATVPTGLTISGSPITSAGTLAFGYATGYSIPTNASQTTWDTAYSRSLTSASVTGTTTKTLTLNQQGGGTITASWSDLNTDAVTSVFGRTGAVVATSGDYSTTLVTEGTNLYYTDARARASNSFSAGSGAYNSTTGVITIPTNNNQITNGAGYITTADLTGYIPYTGATTSVDLNNQSVVNVSHLGINTTSVPTILLRAVGDNNSSSRIAMRGYSSNTNSSSIRVTKFRGTVAAPQAPQSGDSLGKFELAGYGTTSSEGYPQASFEGLATENWGATARGSKAVIKVTPNTTITQVVALTINQDKSAVFENSVTGTSLIKTGGSSIQFLKADGSVDSSSYITLASLSFAAGSGAYNSSTGVITIPTNNNQITNGSNYITLASLSATSPLSYNSSTGAFSISQANTTTNGYLSFTDWNTFNGKQAALNGTGFVKASGTTISYDNSTYLTTISGITAGGELSGTYANPSLVNSAVTGKVLTGVNITGGTVVDTDSILTAFGKVQNQINGLIGGSIYKGTWNASTNTPTLTSSVGTSGNYYIVSVAGSTNLNGITDWQVGDWAIFQGSVWQKVDNTDSVVSVNGFTGAVSLTTSNISEGSNLYYTNARTIASSLTGYTSGAGTITSSDTILTAIQKLNGNIGSLTTGVSSVFGRTGAVVSATGDYTTSQVTEGSNLYYTDVRARASLSFAAGSGAYNSTTGVITIPTNNNQITNGSNYITLGSLSSSATGLTYTNTTGVFSLTAGYVIPTTASATNWDTAYTNRITSLTTTGSSGSATLVSNVLNVPTYTLSGLGGISLTSLSATSPLSYNNTTGAFTIAQATTSTSGYLSSTDWNTFNGKQAAINGTGFVKASGTTISYDNSTYLTTSSAASTYLALAGGTLTGALNGTSAVFSSTVDGTIINSTSNAFRLNGNNALSLVTLNSQSVVKINAAGFWGVQLVGANDKGILIDNIGSVGIGTTSPNLLAANVALSLNNASNAAIEINNNAARAFYTYTDATRSIIAEYRSVPLIFRTADTEQMRITSGGNVLMGSSTDTGLAKLQVTGSIQTDSQIITPGVAFPNSVYPNRIQMYISGGNLTFYSNAVGNISNINSSTGIYTPTSDINKKKDFEISTIGLNEILKLKPTLFRMIDEFDTNKHLGFIAQEVKEYIPDAYVENKEFIGLQDRPILAAVVKAVQEQQQLITSLQARLDKAGL
jgi:hypothetical protein